MGRFTSIPVGELLDRLEKHRKEGLIRAYGVSNWRLPRVREAIAYCKEHGYQGLSASSPSYSLATVTESRWKECIYIDDSEAAQYNDLALPIFSWSSQGAGFFAQIPGRLALPDLNKAYCTDTNFEKLRRATEIAEEKGVSATNIALAYVLNQGYRIAAILGPRTKEEMRDSAAAAEITLSSADVEYLSLRSDKR